MTKMKKRRLNQQHHHHSLPYHQPTHPSQDHYKFFFKKNRTFFTDPPSKCTDQSIKRRFQVDQKRLVEFKTQPRTASATTKGQRLESAPVDWATWNLNQPWQTWATSVRRLELRATTRPTLVMAIARRLG